MTEHDDDLTTQLTRSLADRSDVMSGTSFGLAEVKGRARSLRRRRMATAVVGAAAAVAVIIPTVSRGPADRRWSIARPSIRVVVTAPPPWSRRTHCEEPGTCRTRLPR